MCNYSVKYYKDIELIGASEFREAKLLEMLGKKATALTPLSE